MVDIKTPQIQSRIKPISYQIYHNTSKPNNNVATNSGGLHITVDNTHSNYSNKANSICISADIFKTNSQLGTIHDNWLINLSNIKIPQKVTALLQLGGRFGLPLTQQSKEKTIVNFIKHIENNLKKTPESISEPIRNLSYSIINRLLHNDIKIDNNRKFLTESLWLTESFIKDHPELLFIKADKRNTTVAINVDDYLTKMREISSDTSTYITINNNPIKKLTSALRSILFSWKSKKYINRKLLTTDGILSRAYGLPKIHKSNVPLRIIVSAINNLFYELSIFLHNIIKNSIPEPPSFIKNNYHLVHKLNDTKVDPGYEITRCNLTLHKYTNGFSHTEHCKKMEPNL